VKARLGGCGNEVQYEREEKAFKRNLEASHVTRSKYLPTASIENESSLEERPLYRAYEIIVEAM
jgi:hypothetical protein